ncbi:MAG: thrombospondin type 3 repeat-containing protein [Gammaproteobacteria bacterium]|nr:thrombospondin type 3 repeat-containing protein [Gammaproteobacteria bacterium]
MHKSLNIFFLVVLMYALGAAASTPDGETPAEEQICTDAGLRGAAWGLCNAYCEAMDCDGEPHASETACNRVLAKFLEKTDAGFLPPCLDPDTDGDGIADSEDNCPAQTNADQADGDGDGVGDACDNCPTIVNPDQAEAENGNGLVCDCPCYDHADIDQTPPLEASLTLCGQNSAALQFRGIAANGVDVLWEFLAAGLPEPATCKYNNSADAVNIEVSPISPTQLQGCEDLVLASDLWNTCP